MPNLKILDPTRSRQYAGRKGLGIRAFCKSAANRAGWGLGPQLVAIRNIQGPQIVTNAIIGSHSESRAGYVEADAGLRDAGSIEFDANFVPESAHWQNFNDYASFFSGGRRGTGGFMGALFGSSGQEFNRSGMTLEDPHAHLYELYMALPNTLTLIHMDGFPSMMGPIVAAMESIMMSQFSFKISGAPAMMRPLSVVNYSAQIAAGAITLSNTVGTPVTGLPAITNNVVPSIAFGADTLPSGNNLGTYGGLVVSYDAANMAIASGFRYESAEGSYMLRLVYPGEYEIFSDIKKYSGTGAFVFGETDSFSNWPILTLSDVRDLYTDFREAMGTIGGTRKAGWYAILYRCEWLDD